MEVIVLAAGLGTRIQSVNSNANKCMLVVNGESLLQRKLKAIAQYQEVEHIYIVIHKNEMFIQNIIGDFFEEIPVYYIRQKVENSGIMQAVFNVLDEVKLDKNKELFLALGDEYFEQLEVNPIMRTFKQKHGVLAVAVPTDKEEKIKNNYTILTSENMEIENAVEKPKEVYNNLIGTGIVVMQTDYLLKFRSLVEAGKYKGRELVDLLNHAKDMGYQAYAYVYNTSYYNINTSEDLNEVTKNEIEYPDYEYVVDLFRDTVKRYGERTAIVEGSREISFQELDRLSDWLCAAIQKKENVKEKGIGIICGRTIEHLVSVLAILKAGAFYIPIDEHLPEKRIQYMLDKSKCLFVIGKKELYQHIELNIPIYEIDSLINENKLQVPQYCYDGIKSKNAYIIFTSGSTGLPKGAVLTEKGLLNLVWGMQKEIQKRHNSEHLQIGVLASFSFDLSVQQIFSAILLGHTLHIIPYEAKFNGRLLIEYLNKVDVCDGTPMIMNMLNQHMCENPEDKLTLKHYICAGETLRKATVHKFFEMCPDAVVTNAYGPTECTVETTLFHLDRYIEEKYEEMPIGKPIGNMRVYILDEEKKLLPQNTQGEIWIAGAGVGKGYVNAKDLTDKAFHTDILDKNQLMYKTGDAGYFSTEGQLCYIGRLDNQIKYKGYRIETGEIEKVFERYNPIKECRVLLVHDEKGDGLANAYLAAYLVAEKDISVKGLLEHAKGQLPEYMLPQFFVPVEKFEMNNSGKLNKDKLPDFKKHALRDNKTDGKKDNHTELEESAGFTEVVAMVEQYTGKIDDYEQSLISQGLDSLRMYELLTKLAKTFQVQMGMKDFNLWMNVLELYQTIQNCQKNQKEEIKTLQKATVQKKQRGVNASGILRYICAQEEINREAQQFEFMNQMVYFVKLKENINYDSLDKAYQRVQQENETFGLQIISRGGNYKFAFQNKKIEKLYLKEECCVLEKFMSDNVLSADIDDSVLDEFKEELSEVAFDNKLYKAIFCTYKSKKILLISFHHVIFDYLSLVNFLEQLSYYYTWPDGQLEMRSVEFLEHIIKSNQNVKTGFYKEKADWGIKAAGYVSSYSKQKVFENIKKEIAPVTCVWKEVPYAKKCGCKLAGYCIPESIYMSVEKFSEENQVSKVHIYEAVFYYMLQKFSQKENPAYLFFTSGRKEISQMSSIGFFSHPLFFEGHDIKWSDNFLERIRQQQARKVEIENNMISPWFMDSIDVEKIISEEFIFDYQKLYGISKESIWTEAYPFEASSYSNPVAFRIFDYGMYADISIICNEEYALDGQIEFFLAEFCECCNKLL